MTPTLIYDNLCYSCTRYAMIIDKILKGRIRIIGHYTSEGKQFKRQIFPEGYEGLSMSWFVSDTNAFGGRAGLIELIKYIVFKKKCEVQSNNFTLTECTSDCKTVKGVMFRSFSILTEAAKLKID